MEKTKERLLNYYSHIMRASGKKYDESKMKDIISKVSDEDGECILEQDANVSQMERIAAYAEKLTEFQLKQADNMEDLLKNVGEYDYSGELSEKIGENIFNFSADFPIDDYREELKNVTEVGEEFHVSIDDGKLVIY